MCDPGGMESKRRAEALPFAVHCQGSRFLVLGSQGSEFTVRVDNRGDPMRRRGTEPHMQSKPYARSAPDTRSVPDTHVPR